MDKDIAADLYRYRGLKGVWGFFQGLRIPGFRFIFLYRKAKKYQRSLFYRFFLHHYTFKYGFQISRLAEIGPGLFLPHTGGVVIGDKTKIGGNCDISHGVTIGREWRGERKGSPTIADRVWIGPGAVIVGKIFIGSNVLIAPNSFVNFDVPKNSIVIGNPAKIIKKIDATKNYINYLVD